MMMVSGRLCDMWFDVEGRDVTPHVACVQCMMGHGLAVLHACHCHAATKQVH